MSCKKYIITNTGNDIVTFNYRDCKDAIWQYEVELSPNQTKTIWLINGTFSSPFHSFSIISEDYPPLPPPSPTPEPTPEPTTTPTMTPTPSTTPALQVPFDFITIPYDTPQSGKFILPRFSVPGASEGTTNPNTARTNGLNWSLFDRLGNDRTEFFSYLTGNSTNISFTQNGNVVTYYCGPNTLSISNSSVIYNPNTIQNRISLVSPSLNDFQTGQTVYVSYRNTIPPTPSFTPTPTQTPVCTLDYISNQSGITVGNGSASSYPITFTVTDLNSQITSISIELFGYSAKNSSDIGMVLVAPNGNHSILIGRKSNQLVDNVNIYLGYLEQTIWDGYSDGNYTNDVVAYQSMLFNSPCPVQFNAFDTTTNFSEFVGLQPVNANGTWSLYVQGFSGTAQATINHAKLSIYKCPF
jgi:hypothetical protein